MTTKEQFLVKHNSLSPVNLQATMEMLVYFENKKPGLFKDGDCSIKRIRRPFVFWLTSITDAEKEKIDKIKS